MKAFLAVFLTLVVSSQCNNCHWGPSYWCKSQDNAAECGTVQYCQEVVWKNGATQKKVAMKADAPQGLECDVCQEVMKIVGEELTKNSTESSVKNALLSFCNSTGPLASTCTSFVDQYFDEIWQLIVTDGLDPTEVCGKLGLCASAKKLLKKVRANPIECEVCEMVAKELLNLVEGNATETEAEVEIKKVCPYLGGFESQCQDLIDTFFPELWEAAMKYVDNATFICAKISLCGSSRTLKMVKKVSVGDNPLCEICDMAVSFIKPYVDSDKTEDEVKAAVLKLCALLPGNTSDECSGLVGSYFDLIWDLVKSEVDSGEICKQLGFCNSTATLQTFKVKPRPLVSVGDACDICQAAVNLMKPYVDNNDTEKTVKNVLEEACAILPSEFKDECTSIIDQYFDLVWLLLKSEVDSGEICKQIGLCPNATKILLKKTKSSNGTTLCSTCKTVVAYVRDLVDNNITETVAKDAVEDLCKKAGPLADECKSLIDQYFPMIWKLIRSYTDDDQICAEIKLCSSTRTFAKVQAKKAQVGGVFCMVCELVMKELISMLDVNSTKQDIEDALDKVCNLLPSSVSDDCTVFVKKYGSEIIDLILSGTGAKAVCTALGLCLGKEETMEAVIDLGGEKECSICKAIIDGAKALIALKGSSAAKALDEVCNVVPSGLKSECKVFIDTYGPQLVELLEKAIDADTICKEIKLCSDTKTQEYKE